MIIDFGNGIRAGTSIHDRSDTVQGLISGHSGAEFPDVEVRGLEGTLRDGGTLFGSRAPMRRVTFFVSFRGLTRRELARAFVPGLKTTLSRITPSTGSGEVLACFLPCTLDSVSFRDENLNQTRMALSFISEQPYPLGNTVLKQATSVEGTGYEYPYGYAYEYDPDPSTTVYSFWSPTEVDAEPVITVTSTGSAALLTVTLNEAFTVDRGLVAGDIVVINCAERTVTINGQNALEAVTESSEWPVVVPGNNTVTLSAAGTLTVAYDPRLVGLL